MGAGQHRRWPVAATQDRPGAGAQTTRTPPVPNLFRLPEGTYPSCLTAAQVRLPQALSSASISLTVLDASCAWSHAGFLFLQLPFFTEYSVLRCLQGLLPGPDHVPPHAGTTSPLPVHPSAGTANSPAGSAGVSLRARFPSLRVACWSHGVRTPEAERG